MNIKDIALKVLRDEFPGMRQENQTFMIEFAEALVAELAKGNEPVAWCVGYDSPRHSRIHSNPTMYKPEAEALVLATVPNFGLSVCDLYTLPPTAEQIEQETAEAIAKMLDDKDVERTDYCIHVYEEGELYKSEVIAAVRSGAWKEYK